MKTSRIWKEIAWFLMLCASSGVVLFNFFFQVISKNQVVNQVRLWKNNIF
jgi:hypothetical protein